MRPVVYVAGPFRADTAWGVELNIRNAEAVSLELWKMGYTVICPHTNSRLFHGEVDNDVFMEGYLEVLRRCDCMFVLPGWERSEGTLEELGEANKTGIPVMNSLAYADECIKRSRLVSAVTETKSWYGKRTEQQCRT